MTGIDLRMPAQRRRRATGGPGPGRVEDRSASTTSATSPSRRRCCAASGPPSRSSGRCGTSSLEIPEGSTFGLMGHNGSGKSTLLKCIAKILQPNEGSITLPRTDGRHARARVRLPPRAVRPGERLPQRLDPGDEPAARSTASSTTIVDFAGVGEFIDQPVKNYSSGMYVRLGFSVAIHVEPDILLVDEILAVGDMQFQEKCREKFAEFKDQGRTVVVVSHGSVRCGPSATRPPGSTTASWSRSARPRRSSTTTSRPVTWPGRWPPAAPGTAAARSSSTGSSCSVGDGEDARQFRHR